MADTIVTLSGDDAALFKAFQRMIGQDQKFRDSLKDTEATSKKTNDSMVADARKLERENKRAADAIYREHKKMLEAQDLENRKANQKAEALARKTAITEAQEAIKAAEKSLAAAEKVAAKKRREAERAAELAEKTADAEVTASEKRIQGLAAAVTSYASLNTIAGLYKQNLQEQIALQDQSLAKVNEIAGAQSNTLKNLSGLSTTKKAEVLASAKQLQAEIGFSDQAALVNAIGSGYSASGDLQRTLSAVRAAAELTRLTPGDLPTVASGALDASRGTGVADAKQNLSFLLQAGAISRVEDPTQLARTLSPTITSGVATVPGQNRADAAKEIAAIFSELNQFATDTTGDSTRTATNTLLSKLETFFRDSQNEANQLKGKIEDIQKREQSKAGLDEQDKRNLADYQKQLAAVNGLTDSGSVLGRIQQISASPELKKQFFSTDFGEAAFKGGFRQLFEQGPLIENVRKNKGFLNFDTKEYNQTLAELETISPETRTATENARTKAILEQRANSPEAATVASIRELANDALTRNRRGLIGGALDVGYQGFESALDPANTDVRANAQFQLVRLQRQQDRIRDAGGSTPEDINKLADLEAAKEAITQRLARFELPQSTADRTRELDALDRQNKLLESIDNKIGQPNNSSAIRGQLNSPNNN